MNAWVTKGALHKCDYHKRQIIKAKMPAKRNEMNIFLNIKCKNELLDNIFMCVCMFLFLFHLIRLRVFACFLRFLHVRQLSDRL